MEDHYGSFEEFWSDIFPPAPASSPPPSEDGSGSMSSDGGGGGASKEEEEAEGSSADGGGGRGGRGVSRRCAVCPRLIAENSHFYYGAQVCTSCRTFFQRCARSGRHSEYRCAQDGGRCGQVLRCKACRFRRCTEAGMKVTWVGSRTRKKSKKRPQQPTVSSSPSPSSDALTDLFTEEEERFFSDMRFRFFDKLFGGYFDFYARSPTYLVHFLHCAQHGNPLHPRWASEMAQLDRHTVAQFCLTDDRLLGAGVGTGGEVLLRAAMPGLLGFLWSMNSDVQLRSWVDDFFQYGRGRLGHYDSYRVAKETCVASMGKGYRCTRTFYSYDLVHSTPWGPKRDLELQHEELTKRISSWTCEESAYDSVRRDSLSSSGVSDDGGVSDGDGSGVGGGGEVGAAGVRRQQGRVDHVRAMLLFAVLLFTLPPQSEAEEEISPETRSLAESHQHCFAYALHRYLRSRFGPEGARRRLHQGLMVAEQARSIADIRGKMLIY